MFVLRQGSTKAAHAQANASFIRSRNAPSSGLVVLQNPYDLIFGKATVLHVLVLCWARTNFKMDYSVFERSCVQFA